MRACSRNRSTMLMTRMLSLVPRTPGRRQQMPRTMRSIDTPAWEARYSALITGASTSAFILAMIRRREREPLPRRRRRIAGQQVEQGARIVGVRVARGEVRQIAVDARRRGVVV